MQLASQVVGNLASDLARLFWPPMVRAFKNEIAYPPSILFKSTGPKTFQIQIVSNYFTAAAERVTLMHRILSESQSGPLLPVLPASDCLRHSARPSEFILPNSQYQPIPAYQMTGTYLELVA
jgi:hypothetical protein